MSFIRRDPSHRAHSAFQPSAHTSSAHDCGGDDDFSPLDGDDDDDADWSDMEEVTEDGAASATDPTTHVSMTSASRSRAAAPGTDAALRSSPVTRELQRRIARDLEEVRLLAPLVASGANMGGGTRVSLRVGFPVSSLGMNAEQLRAWALHSGLLLMVELAFPAHYFYAHPAQIVCTVGMAPDTAAPTEQTPLTACKVTWPLENRIRRQSAHTPYSHSPAQRSARRVLPCALADVALWCGCSGSWLGSVRRSCCLSPRSPCRRRRTWLRRATARW